MVILENLVTEKRNEATEGLDQIPVAEALKLMNAEDKKVAFRLKDVYLKLKALSSWL